MSLTAAAALFAIISMAIIKIGQAYPDNYKILVESEDSKAFNASSDRITYSGNQVWKVYVENEEKRNIITSLAHQSDISTWGGNATNVDILVDPVNLDKVARKLRENTISFQVMIEDLQKAIDEENPVTDEELDELQDRKGHPLNWISYKRAADIYSFLNYVGASFPALCQVINIGSSVEGRPLLVLKISNKNPRNKQIWIDGGIHAREWISPASVTYIINHLTENFEKLDPALQNIDWHILALANPDGYEFTHIRNRLWRKNRARGTCRGTDLNRNFGYGWGGKGTSTNPCDEIYRGPGPFSEPESRAIRDYILGVTSRVPIKAYITYHSYGQYILYPWGYDKVLTDDNLELQEVGDKIASSIQSIPGGSGSHYKVGPSAAMLYPASGGSDDWAKGSAGIKYAYTIELRDTGRYGFVLPASLIKPTADEAWSALNVIANAVSRG